MIQLNRSPALRVLAAFRQGRRLAWPPWLPLLLAGLALSCSGQGAEPPIGKVNAIYEGRVLLGPVEGATVTLYKHDDANAWVLADSTQTDNAGAFHLETGSSHGELRLEESGGDYRDLATGNLVRDDGPGMENHLLDRPVNQGMSPVFISPVSSLEAAYARWRVRALQEPLGVASARSKELIGGHFGSLNWDTVDPIDATSTSASVMTDNVREGVLLAGFSNLSGKLADRAGIARSELSWSQLVQLLIKDIEADGHFDGLGENGVTIEQQGISLDGRSLRMIYAASILEFLASPRNATGLGASDVDSLVRFIASNNSEIFSDDPGLVDLVPPGLEILEPAEGAGAQGSVFIHARATDSGGGVARLAFLEPASLRGIAAENLGTPSASLKGTLDVSPLDDGPISLELYAEDAGGLRTTLHRQLIVTNHSPTIVIQTPARGDTLKGRVAIAASATPNPATGSPVVRLELINPYGLNDDELSAATLSSSWDTLLAPEGPQELVFEASDAIGALGRVSLPVIVDNRPPPHVSGQALLAGVPIQLATVEVLALDQPGGRVIASGQTGSNGSFDLTLSDENTQAPLSIQVLGNAQATLMDPLSDSALPFSDTQRLATYAPNAAEGRGVLVSLWTTLAESLARYYVSNQRRTAAAAWDSAQEMIAGHLKRPVWPSLVSSRPADLSQIGGLSVDGSRIALAEFGLLQLAHETSLNDAGLPLAHPVQVLTGLLADDLSDGVFDGLKDGVALAQLGSLVIDSETTRATLAGAVQRFILDPANASGLTPATLQSDGFFDFISDDSRVIYPTPGKPFDNQGPRLIFISPTVDQSFGEELVQMEALATDPSGVRSFELLAPAAGSNPGVGPDQDPSAEHMLIALDNRVAPDDGLFVTLSLRAEDRNGNVSVQTRRFTRTAPTVTLSLLHPAPNASPVGPATNSDFQLVAVASGGFATSTLGLFSPAQPDLYFAADNDTSPRRLVRVASISNFPMDGPVTLGVVHTTIDGREDRSSAVLLIDRQPPVAQLQLTQASVMNGGTPWLRGDAGVGPSASAQFSYNASDATTGVFQIRFQGTGTLADGSSATLPDQVPVIVPAKLLAGSFQVSLQTGCYQLRLRAEDQLGQFVVTPDLPLCVDATAPTLQDLSSKSFDDERELDFVWLNGSYAYQPRVTHVPLLVSDALASTPSWAKMEQRVHGSTEAEAAAQNLPLIYVDASDGTGPGSASLAQLQVEYLHETSIDGVGWGSDGQGWRPLAAVSAASAPAGATHFLALSADTLGATFLVSNAYHRVTVRVRDLVGNEDLLSYSFRMQILPAPVALEVDTAYAQAGDPLSAMAYSFAGNNMSQLFNPATFASNGGKVRLAHAILHQPWPFDVVVQLSTIGSGSVDISTTRRTAITHDQINLRPCVKGSNLKFKNITRNCNDLLPISGTLCANDWGSADLGKLYSALDASGTPTCFCTDTSCSYSYPVQTLATASTSVTQSLSQQISFTSQAPDGSTPLSTTAIKAQLATGVYEVWWEIPAPTNPFYSQTISPATGAQLFGIKLRDRELLIPASEVLENVTAYDFATRSCLPTGATCTSYKTENQRVFDFNSEVNIAITSTASTPKWMLSTTSANDPTLVTRVPYTGGSATSTGIPILVGYNNLETDL